MSKNFFHPVDQKISLPKIEHEVFEFWEKNSVFEKTVKNRRGKPKYVFFDGPPFANGLPHYGHILANALKDAVTRYLTMRGFYVPRVNGWDCHGLPVEYEIEKELKISGRKDIEKMGVSKFNAECRKSVFRYTEEWEKLLQRIARWVDFEHSYATLENNYMESIWWVFKEIWKQGLIYQGDKNMHICPRCETPLSNFEVTLGYKDIADLATVAKFKITDKTFLKKFCGNEETSFVAWTTTPWSIPTTMGLAVGASFEYVVVKIGDEQIICAKSRLDYVTQNLKKEDWKIVKTLAGKDMVGISYAHPFSQYENHPEVKGNPRVWKTYAKDYVSVEDGTGIVTINGAFGEIDMESAKESRLPIIVNVRMDGTYTEEMGEFAGMRVKAGDLDKKIADFLESKGALLRRENIRHSYPHCWRCDTPLLNYATKAWFIRVTDVKEKLLKNNQKIHWIPEHIQDGRFGKWLEGARDWNISRNRFWGCPIPMWQCECGEQKCVGSLKELRESSVGGNIFYVVRHGEAEQNQAEILNSNPARVFHLTKEGKEQVKRAAQKLTNILRAHGASAQAERASGSASASEAELINIIFCSNFPRATETADIFAEQLKVPVTVDHRLREHDMGIFDGKNQHEYVRSFADLEERYYRRVEGGESFKEMEERVIEFINYLNRKYAGKKIVIVTHGDVIRAIARYFDRLSIEETFKFKPGLAAVYEYRAGKLPLRDTKLDLHKPYIDEIKLECEKCGKSMTRIPEVLDCWFESGSMPYAQLHYPFENKKEFEDNFPAHFIAEGLDQTRGWFYTLHVLATILFDKPAFNNVIVNGILLAADGEKLSKRKKNYPDPNKLFETHGVDSTRMFLYASTAPLAEDVRFSEKHVEEMVKQFTLTLWNTYSFFVTYANIDHWTPTSYKLQATSSNKLDEWILSELHTLISEVTQHMDAYNLTKATRPLMAFTDNLSNWYVRRSRRRFWKSESDSDKAAAYETLYAVLTNLALLIAPFMPFTAEAMYKNLTGKFSVHGEDWPTTNAKFVKRGLNEEIKTVRTIVSLALRIRAKKNLKVRQPLKTLMLALPQRIPQKLILNYRDVILEELNVKEMKFEIKVAQPWLGVNEVASLRLGLEGKIAIQTLVPDARKIGPRFGKETQKIIDLAKKGDFRFEENGSVTLPAKGKGNYTLQPEEFQLGYRGSSGFDVESENGILVGLDTTITEELKEEGCVRDLVRSIQELRKKANYGISDRIYVYVAGPKSLEEAVTHFADFIKRETLAMELQEGGNFEWDAEEEVEIDGMKVKIGVRK